MEYLNAKQIIGRLKQGRVADISEAYFSQLVRGGYIPYHKLKGKRRKLFLYEEVKKALSDMQDPTRDAQREANARRREKKQTHTTEEHLVRLEQRYQSAISLEKITAEELKEKTGFNGVVLEHLSCDLIEAKTLNAYLSDIAIKQRAFIRALPFDAETAAYLELSLLTPVIENMTTPEAFESLIENFYTEEDVAQMQKG